MSWLTLSRLMVGKRGRPHDRDMSRGYIAGTSPRDIMRDTAQTCVAKYLPRICCRTCPGDILQNMTQRYVAGLVAEIWYALKLF